MFAMSQQAVSAACNQNSAQSVGKIFLRLIVLHIEWGQEKKTTFFQTIFHSEKDYTEMKLKR
jgi:hypothetical protein